MRAFWEELRELAAAPDFLAIVLLCLLLGAGGRIGRLLESELPRFRPAAPPESIWSLPPLPEVLEELREELRLPLPR